MDFFSGDYREEVHGHDTVTKLQLNRTLMLLDYGVKNKYLLPEYRVLAGKDYKDTESPGSNLYNEIIKWEHYDEDLEYSTITCDHIHELNFSENGKLENSLKYTHKYSRRHVHITIHKLLTFHWLPSYCVMLCISCYWALIFWSNKGPKRVYICTYV